VPPLSHLTSCKPIKTNQYLVNSLATVLSEPDLYRLLMFHMLNLVSLFHCLCIPQDQPISGDLWNSSQHGSFYGFLHLTQPPSCRTTLCWLSVTAYSIQSQLPSILAAIPPSATSGHATQQWQGTNYHRSNITIFPGKMYLSISKTTPQKSNVC
jgi:hypothetical protein